jgi:hypothetical protein
MPAKQIIVLGKSQTETEVTYNVLFWFPITSKPQPQTTGSAWTPVTGISTGAAAAENTAIQNGTVKEESYSFSFPVGTPVATIEAYLQQAWTNRNAQIAGVGAYQYYGSYYDGAAWGQT